MYIGLLTETFYKVYNNSKAYALTEQASTILNIEKVLSKAKKAKTEDFIHEYCGPVVSFMLFFVSVWIYCTGGYN